METFTIISGLLLLVVTGFYLRFLRKRSTEVIPNVIATKYKALTDHILGHNKSAKVENVNKKTLNIYTSDLKDAAYFSLTEVDNRLIIVWTWPASGFGRRGKEWSFPESYSQEKMYDEVMEDLLNYQQSLYQNHNQRMPATA